MRVVLNSDILFTNRLIKEHLPRHIENLASDGREMNATIVIPRTALLEVQRRQKELVEQERNDLKEAKDLLATYGITAEVPELGELVQEPDVVELLRAVGVNVEIVDPTFEDYRAAEEVAVLHGPPLRPDSKSDEMRDLVIWNVALRLSRQDGGAVLLSRDEVHVGQWGDEIAEGVGLRRANSIDAALTIIGVESPHAQLARSILEPIWPELFAAGVGVSSNPSITRIVDATFIQGAAAISSASIRFVARTPVNSSIRALITVSQGENQRLNVQLTDRMIGDVPAPDVTVAIAGELPESEPSNDKLIELRNLLENA